MTNQTTDSTATTVAPIDQVQLHTDQGIRGLNVADYIIAGAAGLVTTLNPLGSALSIGVLYGASKFSGQNQRWTIWSLAGVVGVPLTWVANVAILAALTGSSVPAEIKKVVPSPTPTAAVIVVPSIAPSVTPTVTASPNVVKITTTVREPSFEMLSFCDQLDVINKVGKSIPEFIINSNNPDDYLSAVKTDCDWHSSQANVAFNVMNPVVVETPIIIDEYPVYPAFSDSAPFVESSTAHPLDRGVATFASNCNGVQEMGEEFNANCPAIRSHRVSQSDWADVENPQ